LEAVLKEMTCKNAAHRRDATRILGNFRVAAAVEPLIAATLDDDTSVRSYSWSALTNTLQTLFPQRRFSLNGRGGGSAGTLAWRTSQAEQLRTWWAREKSAPW